MRRSRRLGLLVSMVILVGCKKDTRRVPGDLVVARVDGTAVTARDVQVYLRRPPSQSGAKESSEARQAAVERAVRFQAVVNEAGRRGLDKDPQILDLMRQQMYARLMQQEVEARMAKETISDAAVEAHFRDHTAEYQRPGQARVSQIFIKDLTRARKAADEARAARRPGDAAATIAAFRVLVGRYSEDEDTRTRGGDLGVVDPRSTTLPKPIVEAALALTEVGATTDPIKTERGYHVLQATQMRPAVTRSLAEVGPSIRQQLLRERRGKMAEEIADEIRLKSRVELEAKAIDQFAAPR